MFLGYIGDLMAPTTGPTLVISLLSLAVIGTLACSVPLSSSASTATSPSTSKAGTNTGTGSGTSTSTGSGTSSANSAGQAKADPKNVVKTLPTGQDASDTDYTIHGRPATREQYQAAMLVDEGILLLRSNANEQALAKIKQALALYDGLPEAYHALGVVYTKQGKFEDALTALKHSIELNGTSENTWIMLAGAYQSANDLPHTIQTYNEFLKRFPKSTMIPKVNQSLAMLYAQLGFAFAKQGKTDEAISELKDSIKLNPNLDSSWLTLASVYQATGKIDEAISVYKEFCDKFKSHAMVPKVKALLDALNKEKARHKEQHVSELALGNPSGAGSGLGASGTGASGTGAFGTGASGTSDNSIGGGIASTGGSAGTTVAPDGGDKTASISGTDGTGSAGTTKNSEGRDDYLAHMQSAVGLTRWPASRIPVTVFIHDGSKVPGYRDGFKTILRQAFNDWAKASGGGISFSFVDSPRAALLNVYWTDKTSDLKNPAEAGDARLFMDQHYISKADIWLLTKPVAMPLTDNYFRHITLHEVGHSIGLSGHTTNPDDVMFYSATFRDFWRELTGRDSRSITRLYQSDI